MPNIKKEKQDRPSRLLPSLLCNGQLVGGKPTRPEILCALGPVSATLLLTNVEQVATTRAEKIFPLSYNSQCWSYLPPLYYHSSQDTSAGLWNYHQSGDLIRKATSIAPQKGSFVHSLGGFLYLQKLSTFS